MNKRIVLFCLALLTYGNVRAQNAWIFFHDKGNTSHGDSAVYQPYLDALKQDGYTILGRSRWLNAAAVKGRPEAPLPYPFVKSVRWMQSYTVHKATTEDIQSFDSQAYGKSDVAMQMINLDQYHRMGYTGKGVTLALFDAGFKNADTIYAFDSMWQHNRVKAWYDFVQNDTQVFDNGDHGTAVLSIAGGYYPDSMIGAAPEATFVLARTEDGAVETHQEELNWVMALEWADSIGVDIIHSSLGYSLFDTLQGDYTYTDMDGQSTIITLATNEAIKRGIFVTNSAGNSGNKPWKYIIAPCDGIGVLCVGAVDSFGKKAAFSSFGPSADGRVKPEVMAMGRHMHYVASNGYLARGNGTSLSGPVIAGMVACLKQAWPEVPNDTIFSAIVRSADRYQVPDTGYGYGIPDVLVADSLIRRFVSVRDIARASNSVLYPNPASGMVHIRSAIPVDQVTLLETGTGRVILKHTSRGDDITLDISGYAPGIYTVIIRKAELAEIKRLVIR